jgi:hypothetical protein
VHPDADGQQNHGGEQRAETFGHPACAADAYEKGCNSPGQRSCREGRNPTDVDMTNHLAAIGLAQKGDHGDHDQQRFTPSRSRMVNAPRKVDAVLAASGDSTPRHR